MLKSYQFIQDLAYELEKLKNEEVIEKFLIRLSINQQITVTVVSNTASDNESFVELVKQNPNIANHELIEESTQKLSVSYEFLTPDEAEEYGDDFRGECIDYGLRRSLNSLFIDSADTAEKPNNEDPQKLITFYSYKGGVGRTTGLALAATYLARKGKRVFVLDCDFEAPGLVNFFNIAQSSAGKNGLVEYLNDYLFDHDVPIYNYIYEVEKVYSGSGSINLMPAGNILSDKFHDLEQYLEGLARIDLHSNALINMLSELVSAIQTEYSPDVILVDSRTGFNNIFGALAQLSTLVVVLSGDDIQNTPGTEYISNLLKKSAIPSCFILSILSSNFSKRFAHFKQYIQNTYADDADVFYFDRQNTLEFIGTPLSDNDDLNDFISGENGSVQYHRFFEYLEEKVAFIDENSEATINDSELEISDNNINENSFNDNNTSAQSHNTLPTQVQNDNAITQKKIAELPSHYNEELNKSNRSLQDIILDEVNSHLPDLYAENIDDMPEYMRKYFYIRPCMEDFFVPEKTILLGDKGTGKTAFYQALKQPEFFRRLIEKTQRQHKNFKVFNVTNYEQDGFEFIGLSQNHINDELIIRKIWILFIWNALVQRYDFSTEYNDFKIKLTFDIFF